MCGTLNFQKIKKNAVLLSKYFLNTKLIMYIVATRNPAFHVFKKYFRKRKYMQLCKFTQKYAIFFLSGFSFTNIHSSQDGRGRRIFLTPFYLFPVSQTLGHQPTDYCRELTSTHSLQPDSNREPLVSERKLLTSILHALLAH